MARRRGNWTLQLTRGAAVLTTFAIGGASFLLSFKSLNDLASRAALWSDVAWLWPLTVDMTILSATMAIVALAGYADQGRNRTFFWAMLVSAAMISVGGNALHALLPRDAPLNPWLSAGIAMVVGIRRYQNLPNSPTRPRHVFDMTLVPACGQAR